MKLEKFLSAAARRSQRDELTEEPAHQPHTTPTNQSGGSSYRGSLSHRWGVARVYLAGLNLIEVSQAQITRCFNFYFRSAALPKTTNSQWRMEL